MLGPKAPPQAAPVRGRASTDRTNAGSAAARVAAAHGFPPERRDMASGAGHRMDTQGRRHAPLPAQPCHGASGHLQAKVDRCTPRRTIRTSTVRRLPRLGGPGPCASAVLWGVCVGATWSPCRSIRRWSPAGVRSASPAAALGLSACGASSGSQTDVRLSSVPRVEPGAVEPPDQHVAPATINRNTEHVFDAEIGVGVRHHPAVVVVGSGDPLAIRTGLRCR